MAAWVQRSSPRRTSGFPHPSAHDAGVDLPAPAGLQMGTHHVHWACSAYPSASPLGYKRDKDGAGMLTCCPSARPCGCTLGPDLPYVDQRCVGNLGLAAPGILTPVDATHSGILTSLASSSVYTLPSAARERSPTFHPDKSGRNRSFGGGLSPATFSAPHPSTSELLRTL